MLSTKRSEYINIINKTYMKKLIQKFLAVITATPMLLIGSPAFIAQAASANPALNPADACSLDIALVLDKSGSIGGNEAEIKGAAKAVVNAFLPATDTELGVIFFDSTSAVVQPLTNNVTDLETAIDTLSAGGGTFWGPAIDDGRTMLEVGDRDDADHKDLMIMFSDGSPSDTGEAEADAAKTSASTMPIRILGVGIGTGAATSSFRTITNGGSSVVSPPDAFGIDTDIVMSDFATLEADLVALVNSLCDETIPEEDGGDDTVINKNSAYVKNVVSS
ncbi:MAG: hypothetical protein COU90_02395, partial [Candidatus Ryanbacteria bacterium CG10_big_fil_rev_8_21_14_0_10_43_42]